MIQTLFKLGVFITSILIVVTVVLTIPEFAAVVTTATGSTAQVASAGVSLGDLISTYITPWIGLLNRILPASVKAALMTLISWLILKPICNRLIKIGEQIIIEITKHA